MTQTVTPAAAPRGWIARSLDVVERVGNRLPDPVVLFLLLMLAAWIVSWWLSGVSFSEIDPRTGQPVEIKNQLAGESLTAFMSKMVGTFTSFPPLGVVLVAMLGLGVAEHTGFISAVLRAAMSVTPRVLLTPALIAVGILSHIAVDAGYVLVIPLGAVIFYAAGRHPLAGIAAAFAGVSGGFSATLGIPSSLDPLLAGLTQTAAQLVDPSVVVNPLNNFVFTTVSSALIIIVGWVLTDLVIEPRLRATQVDADPAELPTQEPLALHERRGLLWGVLAGALAVIALLLTVLPADTPWAAPPGEDGRRALLVSAAPLMQSIVPIIFISFLIPGVVYGVASGSVKTHRDVVAGMAKSMSGMGYYIVMAFFCAQFIFAFGQSNLGALLAIKGANALRELAMPLGVTLAGIVLLSGCRQPAGRLGLGQVGAHRGDHGADADAARRVSRPHAGGLPRRRQLDQHHHAAAAVFPADRGVLPPLREGLRHRHAGCADAAVLGDAAGHLDRAAAGVLGARDPARRGQQLRLRAAGRRRLRVIAASRVDN
jgi:aminobenzoyl-glutamate transport protein